MDTPSPDLLAITRGLLERSRGQWKHVAAATGVSHSWISKLARGEQQNPTIRRLQRVHDYLTARGKRRPRADGETLDGIAAKHRRRLSAVVDLDDTGRFVCPRHQGELTITPAACASFYVRGGCRSNAE